MRKLYYFIVLCFFVQAYKANSQDIRFSNVINPSENTWGAISNIAQDRLGYIWFSTYLKGLRRYDGSKVKSYENVPGNPNSLSANSILDFKIDPSNIFWIATNGSGVDRFDPDANSFRHFRHDPKNAGSLCNDTVLCVLVDRTGDLWIGTVNGLDKFNKRTGQFTHFRYTPNDPAGLQGICINTIYQDKSGSIWVSNVTPSKNPATLYSSEGALSKLDITTGKFLHYLHDPANPKSIDNNFISDIYEDSKGNFWLGGLYGVQLMDINKGTFTPWYFNRGSKLYFGPDIPHKKTFADKVYSIREDITGAIWIIGTDMGVIRHEPVKNETRQYGFFFDSNRNIIPADTSSGFTGFYPAKSVISSDGMVWVSTFSGTIYNTNLLKTSLPYYPIRQIESNSFYCESNGKILWVATDSGLLRRDLINGSEKVFQHDPKNDNSVSNNTIYTMRADDAGKFWLGTVGGGLDEFDPSTGNFVHHRHDSANAASIGNNEINGLLIDHNKNIWGATNGGIFKMEKATGIFTNYKHDPADSNSIGSNTVFCVNEDKEYSIWAGTQSGLYKLNSTTGKFQHFRGKEGVTTLCVDSKGILWIGESGGVYFLDSKSNQFTRFAVKNSIINITQVLGITEDDNKNLWVASGNAIYKINAARAEIKRYGEQQNVRFNLMGWNDNFKANDGKLFLGHFNGYYAFYPDKIKDYMVPPHLNIVGFKLGDQEITAAEKGSVLTDPIWKTKEIHLTYSQNVFSFDFLAINYTSSGDQTYFFKLENYDNTWHDIGSDHRAFFFNVPPGNYIFHVKATDAAGNTTEKSIAIIISAPWWRTWWAYTIYAVLVILFGWLVYGIQKRRIALALREKTRAKELAQAEEIRKAYNELRSTQAQLIQSEKMASLGELTAGIAHEIQNPLNFVNNFSEVNTELIDEMQQELKSGNNEEAINISNDIKENQGKISHHGKRADAIVKGMLQHSRSSNGQKEPTNINVLADEYLRLAYHGLRAKDKSFNATMKTDFDESIGNINIIPQDMGRVILNLITNAFYAVNEKALSAVATPTAAKYEPTVSVSTKKISNKIEISVVDNGNGIPSSIKDKIFQPFFTTKPTGQGTGLGLSLSYDIVKAHGGELKLQTKENEGVTFIIQLPFV